MGEKFLTTSFWTRESPKDNRRMAERLAHIMVTRNYGLAATALFGGPLTRNRNERFENDDARFIECLVSPETNYIVLTNQGRKRSEPLFGFSVSIVPHITVVNLDVEYAYFAREEDLASYLDLVADLAKTVSPVFGVTHDLTDYLESTGPVNIDHSIPGVYWGNFYGPEYVSKIGREKLHGFGGYEVRELDGGIISIKLSASPLPPYGKEVRVGQKQLKAILGSLVKPVISR